MIKCAWLTDIHLNFLELEDRIEFYLKIKNSASDIIFITGDIAEAPVIVPTLQEMADYVNKKIYFVAGNHDYYGGQIDKVRKELSKLTSDASKLCWMPASGPVILSDAVKIVGQDGWADGRFGGYVNSRVVVNDSRLILDLFQNKILGKFQLLDKMQDLADTDARMLQADLEKCLDNNLKQIIVLTHVPPFREICLHDGIECNDDWLPFFSSKITGDVLYEFALAHPQIKILVLCGHTHSAGSFKPLSNLTVRAGGAKYNAPEIQYIFTF